MHLPLNYPSIIKDLAYENLSRLTDNHNKQQLRTYSNFSWISPNSALIFLSYELKKNMLMKAEIFDTLSKFFRPVVLNVIR